jgi:transposase
MANPWAAKLYTDAIARGHDHPHAVDTQARAWLYIIWHCWQSNDQNLWMCFGKVRLCSR